MKEHHAKTKADPLRRLAAALIDDVLAAIPSVIPVAGGLLGIAYLLTKDAIVYETTKKAEWKNRSIGKKLLGLEVWRWDGARTDLKTSVQRNWPLAVGYLLAFFPLVGWAAGSIAGFVVGLIEAWLVFTNPQGLRIGDRLANTMVVPSAAETGANT